MRKLLSYSGSLSPFLLCGLNLLLAGTEQAENMPAVLPIVVRSQVSEELIYEQAQGGRGSRGKRFTVIDGSPDSRDRLERSRLHQIESQKMVFREVQLGVVIQALAESCGINYVAPSGEVFRELITLRVEASPFQLMEMLGEQYGFVMEGHHGIWEFFQPDHQQLLSKTYRLRYSDGGSVSIQPPSVAGSVRSHDSQSGARSERGDKVFAEGEQRLIRDIRELLGLPYRATPAWDSNESEGRAREVHARKFSSESASPGGQVYYIAETSSLLVIASRAHHQLVEEYLDALDQQQRLIKIQALIVESSRPETLSLGVDWSGVSGVSLGVGQISRELQKSVESSVARIGPSASDAGLDALGNGRESSRSSSRSDTALLSAGDFAWALNFLKTDEQSRVVNDPVAVTLNRKPVRFETVTELPVQTGSTSTTSAVSSSLIQQTEYIEIGFFLDVIPQIVPGGIYGWEEEAVQLDVSIVVSNQVGQQLIGDRPYPVTARRTYAYSVIVPSGYTLAIGGLREEGERETQRVVPLLGELPLLGFLFRHTETEKINRNLMAYITPVILDRHSPEFSRAGESYDMETR